MARKYIVTSNESELYEPDFKVPFVNTVAGIIWAIPFLQKIFPQVDGLAALGIGAVFTLVYIILCMVPVIAIVPCVTSAIMYITMFWGMADNITNPTNCFIVKGIILVVVVFFEFCIFGNATLLWLQTKFPNKPTVRVIEE